MPTLKITQIDSRKFKHFVAQVITNEFIDTWGAELSPAEFKIAMIILRKTIGWGKFTESIGITEIVKRTGLSRRGVIYSLIPLCHKIGVRYEQVGRSRRRFTWMVTPLVAEWLAKGKENNPDADPGPRW